MMTDQPLERAPAALPGLPRLRWPWTVTCVVALVAAMAVGVLIGPAHLAAPDIVQALLARLPFIHVHSSLDPVQQSILWSLRIPRVVLGALVGGMLATAGAAYQGAFRNPLADPYLLGAASGAELGATLAIALAPGSTVLGINLVPVAAFAGALLAVAGAYALGKTVRGARSVTSLILAGVAIAAFLNAVQTYVQQRNVQSFRQVYSWILGHLVTAGWQGVALILPYVALSVAVIFAHRRLLDALSVGDDEVASLGVSARRVRLVVVGAATVGTAAAVAIGGTIAFVGIIVPHTVRLLVGRSYRVVIPLSLLLGAAFLVLADTLARTIASPAEVPIGVITAFLGAPFFVVVMRSTRTVDP
jgi:iron complex transport system permease protein